MYKLLPTFIFDSTQILPFKLVIIFFAMAKPDPVPVSLALLFNFWNRIKILSKYSSSIPIPLSLTLNNQFFFKSTASIVIVKGLLFFLNLIALSIMFLKTIKINSLSENMVGRFW